MEREKPNGTVFFSVTEKNSKGKRQNNNRKEEKEEHVEQRHKGTQTQ